MATPLTPHYRIDSPLTNALSKENCQMEPKLGYCRTDEVTLIRRKHRIGFRVGLTASDLIGLLQKVPPYATVDEVIDDAGEYGVNIATIEFHEEVVKDA